ncbi:fungal-specific transcription factor domain-containing protein [Rhexocercosporidium sp. MPI-PUGE-AT-0058]|nr:fungal-specific transcription factor domain-containing protein [Rhexocercosporidium sp. MPI-PUGE-AT-0058]
MHTKVWTSTRCSLSGKKCEYRTRRSAKPAVHSRLRLFEARLGNLESHLVPEENFAPDPSKAEHEIYKLDDEYTDRWSHLDFRKIFTSDLLGKSISTTKIQITPEQKHFPGEELQQKLYDLYFEKVHRSTPIIHRSNFFRSLDNDTTSAPTTALKYAMWATAALVSPEHQHVAERLYALGRKHAEDLERNSSLKEIAPSHAQCWYLLALYEGSQAYFGRAWMSVGRCGRLVQMLSLHRLDSPLEEKHALWQEGSIELEEGWRVFWGAYLGDRLASTLSGHPHMIRDEDICTNLPSSEQSFELGIEEMGISLKQAYHTNGVAYLSPFAWSIFTTATLGRTLSHIRAFEHDIPTDINGNYWKSHRDVDTSISLTFLNLPTRLREFGADEDMQVVMSQFNLHVSVILLQQVAVSKVVKQKMNPLVRQNSFQRCLMSALQIKDIIYCVKDLTIFSGMMWIPFCVYVAAGVFIEDLTSQDPSPTSAADLGLLLIALKEINAHQSGINFFARRLESDISRTGVACHIPTDLRGMAGFTTTQQNSIPAPPSNTPYCDTSQYRYS